MSKKKIVTILASVTALLLFKVYISNSIYFLSRDIQKTRVKIDALKEEQSILKLKIEKLKYKNEISDPLFNYEQDNQDNTNYSPTNQNKIDNSNEQNSVPKSPEQLFDTLESY